MNNESNIFKNIITVLLTLLVLGLAAGTASAGNATAGVANATGVNVTLNATNATGINASVNTYPGANITVYFNTTNATNTWNINATNQNVSINGSGSPNGTIAGNGTFTLNSSVPTPWFNVTVTNAANSSENATLTGFFFVVPVNLSTAGTFGVLAAAYTNTLSTTITGDLGYSSETEGGTTTVTGTTHVSDDTYNNSGTSQAAAISALALQPCTYQTGGSLDLETYNGSGLTGNYTPGVYCIGGAATMGLPGITLNGTGTYIFRSASLSVTAGINVTLVNGASASDVFWTLNGGATTLPSGTTFAGTVINTSAITVTSTNWTGRALAFGWPVTIHGANITVPSGATVNGTKLTNISGLTQSVYVSTNATYTFSLLNNGTLTDNYTINITSNPNNANAILNITSVMNLASGATKIFTLNVSNPSSGTFPVNITANSTNDPNKLGYLNTTTVVSVHSPSPVPEYNIFGLLALIGLMCLALAIKVRGRE